MTPPTLSLVWVSPEEQPSTPLPECSALARRELGLALRAANDDPDIARAWQNYAAEPDSRSARNELARLLYRRYRVELLRIARHRLCDPDAAVEVVQATYICLIEKLKTCGGLRFFHGDLRGWLLQTTRHNAQNANRGRRRLGARLERFALHCRVLLERSGWRQDADAELDGPRREAAIRLFLEQLDDETREIVLLRSGGRTLRNIAACTGLSESTVRRRLADLRKRLRTRARRDPLLAEMLDEISEDDSD